MSLLMVLLLALTYTVKHTKAYHTATHLMVATKMYGAMLTGMVTVSYFTYHLKTILTLFTT